MTRGLRIPQPIVERRRLPIPGRWVSKVMEKGKRRCYCKMGELTSTLEKFRSRNPENLGSGWKRKAMLGAATYPKP